MTIMKVVAVPQNMNNIILEWTKGILNIGIIGKTLEPLYCTDSNKNK